MRELAVTQNRSIGEFANIQLIEDLACSGKRLDENGLRIAYIFRNEVKIVQGQGEVLGECSIMRNDAKNCAASAMRFQAAAAKGADGLVAIRRAGNIDFAGNAFAEPAFPCFSRGTADFHDFAHKFVPRSTLELVISTQNFNVGIADACDIHANQRPAGTQPRKRLLRCH